MGHDHGDGSAMFLDKGFGKSASQPCLADRVGNEKNPRPSIRASQHLKGVRPILVLDFGKRYHGLALSGISPGMMFRVAPLILPPCSGGEIINGLPSEGKENAKHNSG